MEVRVPILLSYHAIAGETATLIFGQLTYTRIKDFTFQGYSRRKTFRTLLSLYRTKPFTDQEIVLHFERGNIKAKTDAFGSFSIKTQPEVGATALVKVTLASGVEVKIVQGLYSTDAIIVSGNTIVVSDIDDTLMHSFIYRKVKKFRTLMFTTVEKRKAIVDIHLLLQDLGKKGATMFYLSNSEQNLYPLIYRFLTHNQFPKGPLFLKKMRGLWHVIRNIKFPLRDIHKTQTLEEILALFPSKKLILIGDNTQQDPTIYLEAAEKFPVNIKTIVVLKVVDTNKDETLIEKYCEKIRNSHIQFYYSAKVPTASQLDI